MCLMRHIQIHHTQHHENISLQRNDKNMEYSPDEVQYAAGQAHRYTCDGATQQRTEEQGDQNRGGSDPRQVGGDRAGRSRDRSRSCQRSNSAHPETWSPLKKSPP